MADETITRDDIRAYVVGMLTDWVDDFDVDAITDDILAKYGRIDLRKTDGVNVDTIEHDGQTYDVEDLADDLWQIVARHDTTA